ncbi:MFS transporter [Dactylosporangium cerinum]
MVASEAVAKFTGPGLGSGLLQFGGTVVGLSANALSYLASIGGMARIRAREAAPASSGREASAPDTTWRQIADGARFLWRHEFLRPLAISACLRNLAMSANRTVLLLLMYNALHLPAQTVGLVFTCGAAGSILGASLSGRVARRLGVGRTFLLTLTEGLIWLLAPLTLLVGAPAFVLMALMFVSSLWLPIWNAASLTLRQTVTGPELLRRVNATTRTVNLSSIPVGALLGGVAADLAGDARGGLVVVLIACTCGLTLVSAVQLLRSNIRGLRTYAIGPAAPDVA